MKCQICVCWKDPAVPRTSGAPVLFALGPVVLYAASVKLDEVSNAPEPRPSHHGPGVARFVGVPMVETAERAMTTRVSANIVRSGRRQRIEGEMSQKVEG